MGCCCVRSGTWWVGCGVLVLYGRLSLRKVNISTRRWKHAIWICSEFEAASPSFFSLILPILPPLLSSLGVLVFCLVLGISVRVDPHRSSSSFTLFNNSSHPSRSLHFLTGLAFWCGLCIYFHLFFPASLLLLALVLLPSIIHTMHALVCALDGTVVLTREVMFVRSGGEWWLRGRMMLGFSPFPLSCLCTVFSSE